MKVSKDLNEFCDLYDPFWYACLNQKAEKAEQLATKLRALDNWVSKSWEKKIQQELDFMYECISRPTEEKIKPTPTGWELIHRTHDYEFVTIEKNNNLS